MLKEKLARHTFALCIPLDLHDDDASYFIQDRILHLIIIAW
jgi:hypothetical protein